MSGSELVKELVEQLDAAQARVKELEARVSALEGDLRGFDLGELVVVTMDEFDEMRIALRDVNNFRAERNSALALSRELQAKLEAVTADRERLRTALCALADGAQALPVEFQDDDEREDAEALLAQARAALAESEKLP